MYCPVTGTIQSGLKCKTNLGTCDVKRSGLKVSDCDLHESLADIYTLPLIYLGVT